MINSDRLIKFLQKIKLHPARQTKHNAEVGACKWLQQPPLSVWQLAIAVAVNVLLRQCVASIPARHWRTCEEFVRTLLCYCPAVLKIELKLFRAVGNVYASTED